MACSMSMVMMFTATSSSSASVKTRAYLGWPLITRSLMPTVNANARRRSCHLVPDASLLAVGEAGYGRISLARYGLRRSSVPSLGCSFHSAAATAAATACGGAGRAVSAQLGSYTMLAMPSSRKAFAGCGNEGWRRSRHPVPPWLWAGISPSPVRLRVSFALVSEWPLLQLRSREFVLASRAPLKTLRTIASRNGPALAAPPVFGEGSPSHGGAAACASDAAASGRTGWAASAQSCCCTTPSRSPSRETVAGVGTGDAWPGRLPARPWPWAAVQVVPIHLVGVFSRQAA